MIDNPHILFQYSAASVYEENGWYKDARNRLSFIGIIGDALPNGAIMKFGQNSDIGRVAGEPFDLLLQCLEHRLATRNRDDPQIERTNALKHLRNMRMWLGRLAEIEQESS